MKIAYVIGGYPGEFAQAESVASYTKSKGDQNIFIMKNRRLIWMAKEKFEVIYTKNTDTTRKIIKQLKPDVLFLCNSKTTFMRKNSILKKRPFSPRPFICSLDSNWLFLEEMEFFKAPSWIDRIYAVIPQDIYKWGFIEYGGHYKISDTYKNKIFCPGFIPSTNKIDIAERKQTRKELNIGKDENLIFVYFGAKENRIVPDFFPKIEKIINQFIRNGKRMKVLFKEMREKRAARGKIYLREKWFIRKTRVTTKEFDAYFASSDLVIQHHGLGTLPKVILNQIPVICLVPDIKKDLPHYKHSSFYEVQPFRRLNLCYTLPYTVSYQELRKSMESLLYNKGEIKRMRRAQKKYFESGEENLYDDLGKRP